MNFSPSWILLFVLLAGIGLGLVWFSSTSYAGVLRELGVPVPYCTFARPSVLTELDFARVGSGYVFNAADVLAYMLFAPGEDFLTGLCTASERGTNVRVLLSPIISKDRELLSQFDVCKIKYRVVDVLLPNLAVVDRCVLTYGYDRDIVVCDEDYARDVKSYLEGLWRD